jgi:bifunctional non-homologous end joining protein LigD
MRIVDGRWRVEVVRRGNDDFFRLIHGDSLVEDLVLSDLQQLLTEAGVDMADLVEAATPPTGAVTGAA